MTRDPLTRSAVPVTTAPMEARLVSALPEGPGWQFEPKWDGFRCLAFRSADVVEIRGKSGKSLTRYFPEMAAALRSLPTTHFVVDGELTIAIGKSLSFEALQARLHPAATRIRKLASETPAILIVFDCLMGKSRDSLLPQPLEERRAALETLFAAWKSPERLRLSPCTLDRRIAQGWLDKSGGALDGVIAKRRDGPYLPAERAILKVKKLRTADCVVGGFRYASEGRVVGSLLLGLYDEHGALHHVGFTSSIASADRKALTKKLEKLIEPPGFTGNAPGGPSRWSTERSAEWQPLRPVLVVEVCYDHLSDRRFRHGTRLLRWRPDKLPRQCTFEQLQPPTRSPKVLADVFRQAKA